MRDPVCQLNAPACGIRVGIGHEQETTSEQLGFRHMPPIQDKPAAHWLVAVHATLHWSTTVVGAGVGVGATGSTVQSVVEPGEAAIILNFTMANVPAPLFAAVFVPESRTCVESGWVYEMPVKKFPLVTETNCKTVES